VEVALESLFWPSPPAKRSLVELLAADELFALPADEVLPTFFFDFPDFMGLVFFIAPKMGRGLGLKSRSFVICLSESPVALYYIHKKMRYIS